MSASYKRAKHPAHSPVVVTPKSKPSTIDTVSLVFPSGFWRQQWLPSLLLAGLAFLLYGVSINYGYVLDDGIVLSENAFVKKGIAGLREIFAYDSFMGYFQKKEQLFKIAGGRYRPLSLATFALEVAVFGDKKPYISHFFNMFLYACNAILLYRVLLLLVPACKEGRWFFGTAFLATLLFVAHPLHTEVVANIKGRDEILALMGALAALYAAFRYAYTGSIIWGVGVFVFLTLGLLAKENVLTFAAVIPLTIWLFGPKQPQRSLSVLGFVLASVCLFIFVRYQALGYMVNHGKPTTDLMNNPFLDMTFSQKMATIFLCLGWDLKLLVFPHPLTHDYYPYHVPKVDWGHWKVLLAALVYFGMGIWAVLNIRKYTVPAYAILFYLLTISIVSNLFVPVGTFMNERFLYMPSVAFCLLLGWVVAQWIPSYLQKPLERPYVLGLLLISLCTVGFAVRTVTRVPDWRTPFSLNDAAIRVSEGSARAHCFYASALYKEKYMQAITLDEKAPIVAEMTYHIDKSLEIYPQHGSAWMLKPHIDAANFELDKNFPKMLAALDRASNNANGIGPVLQYIDFYVDKGYDHEAFLDLCYRIGYQRFFKEQRTPNVAILFLEAGMKITGQGNAKVTAAAAEVYAATGNTSKAATLRARLSQQ